MRNLIILMAIGFTAVAITACGGSKAKSDAAEEVSAFDQLKALPAEIDGEVAKVGQPIDGVDDLLAQAKALPETHKIKADTMSQVVITALRGDGIAVPATVTGKAKAELETFVKTLTTFRQDLYAVPDRAQTLVATLAEKIATVPALATKASSEAAVVIANPFASPDEKKAAKQQQTDVDKIQADAQARIAKAQEKVKGIPGRATEAMAKFVAGFQSMGLSEEALSALKQPLRDAKQAAEGVRDTAQKSVEDSVDNAGKAVGVDDASGKTKGAAKKAVDEK
jgi:hypothetical protein